MKTLVVDTKKIKNNIEVIKKRANVPVIGVLKGDGYGLGILKLAEILSDNGVTRFAVTEPSDALKLRNNGRTVWLTATNGLRK